MKYTLEREILLNNIKDLYKKGLVYFKSGNLSIRTHDNNVLIKPSGCSYEDMTVKDLVLVNLKGEILSGDLSPSSETPMHTMIYRVFKDVQAVVHTHSEQAIACSITGTEIPPFCNEILSFGGLIPLADYAIPGTDEIAENAVKAFNGPPQVKGVLLRNHGAITIGNNMAEASMRAELLEKLASIYIQAKQIGPVYSLSTGQIEDIIERYSNKKK